MSTETCVDRNQMISLNKVIAGAMVDMYGDINQAGLYQMLSHWAVRGYKKLNNEVLKTGKRKAIITINKNTHTGTLPLDFNNASFIGVIDNYGQKVPIRLRTDLTDTNNIEEVQDEDDCPKCGCNTNVCKDLSITESETIVILNNNTYIQTIVKTLYPNGDYFIETTTPVLTLTGVDTETKATATISITHIGRTGATFRVFILGQQLGEYPQTDDDTNIAFLAASIANYYNGKYGYSFSVEENIISIQPPAGLGSSINGGVNLAIDATQITTGTGIGTPQPGLDASITQFAGGVDAEVKTDGTVTYVTQKEFIAKITLAECGCIEPTPANIEVIKCNAYDCYCCYYAPCCDSTLDAGYQVFEETGLIKFGHQFKQNKVYIEYQGFLPKKNGIYQIPEIAFETLVNWIKYKSVENKKNVPLSERSWFQQNYFRERGNMEKLIGIMSLAQFLQAITLIPRFDAVYYNDYTCVTIPKDEVMPATDNCNVPQTTCPPTSSKSWTPFSIQVTAGTGSGKPTPGLNTYQNNNLINAVGINILFIDNTSFSRNQDTTQDVKDFSIDYVNGILSMWQSDGVTPRLWTAGETLIIPTFFKLV